MKVLLALVAMLSGCTSVCPGAWSELPPLPDKEGFAGSFAGVSDGVLLVAGGANFPDKKPWEGGTKAWYGTIFALEKPDGQWKPAGRLPRALGYGVSVTYRGGVVCVGGSDGTRHYADVFRLEWKAGRVVTTELPPLPQPVANACGALLGDRLYIIGGLSQPDATQTLKTAYQIDLAEAKPSWREMEGWPGSGRMLAVAAGFDGALWVMGGVDLGVGAGGGVQRRYLNDAFRFRPGEGWRRIADLPYPVAATPSPAAVDRLGLFVLGGDDGSQVGAAPGRHRGFNRSVLRYDAGADRWSRCGEMPVAQVTTPCVDWQGSWVVPGGEIRPGVRSPRVWRLTPVGRE
jgi:N-acetylneuraminic acid mutarotase